MVYLAAPVAAALALASVVAAAAPSDDLYTLAGGPIRQIGLFQALLEQHEQDMLASSLAKDGAQASFATKEPSYKAHCYSQPVSHRSTAEDALHGDTFCQRYWFDAQYFKEGGPVYVLDGGETSGENRLPFLDKGIIHRLAQETNGLAVVLEHRYYGASFPYWPNANLSTDSLRFLNNYEALEDSASFIRDVSFEGVDGKTGPVIYYGGSYAGARAAHMRVLYPDLVFGAIASSAVTHAEIFYTDYMDAIRQWAPKDCMRDLVTAIEVIDKHLDVGGFPAEVLKGAFGLAELADDDFASVLSNPLGYWQARNWDPAVGSVKFYEFCDVLTANPNDNKDGSEARRREVVMNYAEWIKAHEVRKCPGWKEEGGVAKCFSTEDDSKFQDISIKQTWRAWLFQVCTEWGYFQGAPLKGPRIVSNRLTLEYTSKICRQAYPKGEFMEVPRWPNVSVVNDLGDYAIKADRLAFIDGDSDPWRPATPNSDHAEKRNDTMLRPVKIISDAVHHFDENGLSDPSMEPKRIQKIHEEEIEFIKAWLK